MEIFLSSTPYHMKQIFLTLLALLSLTYAFGQQTELGVSLNSGLFVFSGPSAQKTSSINYDDQSATGYTNNPYGAKPGICYGLSFYLQRVTRVHMVLGLEAGYEDLRSKVSINQINGYNGISTYEYDATGQTFLNNGFLNLHPFIGYRLALEHVSFDLTGGFDAGYSIKTNERAKAATPNGTKYTTLEDRKTIDVDFRPRIQLSTYCGKFGLYAGYSYGLANYKSGYVGGVNECYARVIRFGVTHQL